MMAYELTEDDLDVSDDDPPSIRAARNPNPAVLSAILGEASRLVGQLPANATPFQRNQITRNYSANTYVPGSIHGIYTSPLVEAIKSCLSQNVDMLFGAGADPNGILLRDLDEYSVRFIRGRDPKYNTYSFVMCPPRSKVMTDAVSQTAPLTASEIAVRRKTFSRFWTEPELPTIRFRSQPARTALETAASVGDVALFNQVRAAGPDESWWTATRSMPSQLPSELTHSALSTSSPVHEVIISRKLNMLEHLLSLGYSPNILPLVAPTCCLSPHMTAIALCDPPNLAAYNLLAQDPRTDFTIRTPVFSIHVLHFATARLDIPLLQHMSGNSTTPLEAAGTTALAHTLLHIASLSLTDAHINLFSAKIFESIHDVRTLDCSSWLPIDLKRRNPMNRGILHSSADTAPLPRASTLEDEAERKRQEEMVLWLLESGTQNLRAKDVYGNTALHYLASAMRVNEELIGKLRAWEGGETVWKESKNEMGHSPEELWEDGRTAQVEQWKTFWMDD